MQLVRQGRNQCGQACVAMVLGVSLEKAVMLVGRKGLTSTRHLVQAIRSVGGSCGSHLVRMAKGRELPETAILLFNHPSGRSHWVVWHRKKFYDPHAGIFRNIPNYLQDSKLTSFLEIDLTSCRSVV